MDNKQLQRSTQNKVIGGVCAGLARYFGIDPVLVRIVFLVALVFFRVWTADLHCLVDRHA